jgi:hypothetical protein
MGLCMCGDPYCHSCGPAQGNYQCRVCGRWSMDGDCDNPTECHRIGKEQDEAFAKQMEEWDKIEADYVQSCTKPVT